MVLINKNHPRKSKNVLQRWIVLAMMILAFIGVRAMYLQVDLIKDTKTTSTSTASTKSIKSTQITKWTCDDSWYPTPKNVQSLWNSIDNITSTYVQQNPKANKVSGGLFLYPRQTNLLQQLIHEMIIQHTIQHHQNDAPFTICETGFGAGHSTAFFVSQSPNVNILSFDKFDRSYQLPIVSTLQNQYTGRINTIKGNSCKTVPTYFQTNPQNSCNLLHGSSLCPTDNIDLVQHAECGVILTSTAMSSIEDRDVYFGPTAQWRKLRTQDCIEDIVCFSEDERRLDKSYIFAKEQAVIQHEFCFAIVTGKCMKRNPKMEMDGTVYESQSCILKKSKAKEILIRLCPSHTVSIPD